MNARSRTNMDSILRALLSISAKIMANGVECESHEKKLAKAYHALYSGQLAKVLEVG